jgi:hypothetical protein
VKGFIPLVTLLIATSIVSFAQTATTPQTQTAPARKNPLADYAGSWIGTFEGHAWLTIRLSLQGAQLTGTLQHSHDLKWNDDGELKSVSQDEVTETVQSAAIQGDGLLLTVKDADAQESDRFVMRLKSPTTADVKMVAMPMPPGMAKPKPWKVTKVTASAVTPAH